MIVMKVIRSKKNFPFNFPLVVDADNIHTCGENKRCTKLICSRPIA